MFRSRSSPHDSDDETRAAPRPSGRTQSAIVAFTAVASGVLLVLSGTLDDPPRVDIDPVTESSTVVERPASQPADQVMLDYLTAAKAWTDCMARQPPDATADVTSSACGTLPEQPDDPQLNAYLADVLDWHKCAAPRLRHGGMEQAVIACGPLPASPLEG